MLTQEEYERGNVWLTACREFWNAHASGKHKTCLSPPWVSPQDNAATGLIEQYEFAHHDTAGCSPECAAHKHTWSAYWHNATGTEARDTITTWVGDTLGTVVSKREYKTPAFGGFPSTRVAFTMRGIDGHVWYGTYYKSSGGYVRMRRVVAR